MNFKSDIDFDNTDDLDIMLPSQRKKQLQNQPNNGKTKKRPPKQKKMSMNPNLFDDEFTMLSKLIQMISHLKIQIIHNSQIIMKMTKARKDQITQ